MPRVVHALSLVSVFILAGVEPCVSAVPEMATTLVARNPRSPTLRALLATEDSWFCTRMKAELKCVPDGGANTYCTTHDYCLDECGFTPVTAYGPGAWEQDYAGGNQTAILASPFYTCGLDNDNCVDASMLKWTDEYIACSLRTSRDDCLAEALCGWVKDEDKYRCEVDRFKLHATECPIGHAELSVAPRHHGASAVSIAGLVAATVVILA